MITYPQFTFASAPRTASTWFIQICADAGLGEAHKANVHTPPAEFGKEKLSVTMCRHPYDWLVSYYLALQGGATGIAVVDSRFLSLARMSGTVERFVKLYLRRQSGEVGAMFDEYKANTVLRVEDLPWNVIELLSSIGKESDTAKWLPAQNAFTGIPPQPNRKLRQAVVAAEREFCERYEYY